MGDLLRKTGQWRSPCRSLAKAVSGGHQIFVWKARAARIQGRVVVEAIVGSSGTVVDAKVVRSIPLLDQAALDAVRQCVYEPTIVNGKPTRVVMTVTVNVALEAASARDAEPPASFDALLAAARFEDYYANDNPARRAAGDAFIRSLIQRYPDDTTPHLLLASALFTPQTMDRYVDALRAIAARFPRDPELHASVASARRDTIRLKPDTTERQQRTLLDDARTWADKGFRLDADNELTLLVKVGARDSRCHLSRLPCIPLAKARSNSAARARDCATSARQTAHSLGLSEVNEMADALTLLAVLAAWTAAQVWVLPRFGVPT